MKKQILALLLLMIVAIPCFSYQSVFNPFTGKKDYLNTGIPGPQGPQGPTGEVGPMGPTGEAATGGVSFDAGTIDGAILKKTSDHTMGAVTAIPQSLIVANDSIVTFSNGGPAYEVGTSVLQSNFSWTMTRNSAANTSQVVSGTSLVGTPVTVTPGTTRAYLGTFSPLLHSTVPATFTYTLNTVGDDAYADSKTNTITFYWSRYQGVSNESTIGDASINAMTPTLALSRATSFSSSPSGQYIYVCYPAAWGIATFTVNGLPNTDWTLSVQTHVNASSGSTSYNVYRTNNLLTGTYSIGVL